jgi:precorrin-2 dehydrogenase/sirohydrochlorin ferrochelatase
MGHGYPILLDVSERRILIVGGGRVASRKAAGVIDAGAREVTAVSPQFVAPFPDPVKRVHSIYKPNLLDNVNLVFAATNRPEVNDAVVRDARARGIWVNRADADEENPGDFVTPAKYQDHNVMLTVSAASAALASSIRDALQRRWDPRWTKMAQAMQTVRPWVRDHSGLSQEQRAVIFRALASNDAMDVLDRGGDEALRAWLIERHPELGT